MRSLKKLQRNRARTGICKKHIHGKLSLSHIIVLVLITFSLSNEAFAQKRDRIEIEQADELEGKGKMTILRGNVILKQEGSRMYTDSAYYFRRKNTLDAYGNVRILQEDGTTITSDKLFYDGDTKLAKLRGNVVLVDDKTTVYTDALDYNMKDKWARYDNKARIVDEENTLTSEKGYYDAQNKQFTFRKNVKVVNTKENFILYSDHLVYDIGSKIATFKGPSTIISKTDTILTEGGQYFTGSGEAVIEQSEIYSGTYTLEGDIVNRQTADRATVQGNVRLFSEEDNVLILGDNAIHRGDEGFTKVFGNSVLIQTNGTDTLFLRADTLISIDNKVSGERKFLGYTNAKIYKEDLQSIADSLIYQFSDSTLYLFQDPVMWSQENQISADSIKIQMVNNKVDKMFLRNNSFMVGKDTLGLFNQIKGKDMTGYFINDTIRQVKVDGNSESIYFALENDTALVGMNKVKSSDMDIRLKDNKVNTITFINNPEGTFIPPHLLEKPETTLSGFNWQAEARPTRAGVLGIKSSQLNTGEKPKEKTRYIPE